MSFDLKVLKDSNEFLNLLLENINSAVLIVDGELRVRQFNGALGKMFGKTHQEIMGELCGEAMGCAFAAVEKTTCGKTSVCGDCQLRRSINKTFRTRGSGRRKKLARRFVVGDVHTLKFLEYSTRFLQFNGDEFILLIMDDVTDKENRKLELAKRQRLINLDLRAAAGIQKSLLPSSAMNLAGIETAWQFLPCSQIGGDIFNLFSLGDGRIGCYIMDASGHGVPSALVAVTVSQLLHPSSSRLPLASPSRVCEELDRRYPLNRFNSFFSMIYMVIDPGAGTITWCNAGHPPALLARANGELEMLEAGGPIIGLGGLLPFREDSTGIGTGDRIVLFTDGLIERRNPDGILLGLEGILSLFAGLQPDSLDGTLSLLFNSAMEYGAGAAPADDISLLGIELK